MRKFIFKIVLDVLCCASVGIPVLLFFIIGEPYKRGFSCDDSSIRYPFKDSTIPNYALYIYAISLPVAAMTILEYLQFARVVDLNATPKERRIAYFWQLYCKIIVFAFGALTSQLLTDIAKYSIGRPRPHFYKVCNPSPSCNDKSGSDIYNYIYEYDCLGEDKKKIRDARLSFMSGHSSFSAYCMVYLAIYLQKRLPWRNVGLVRPLLQILFIYLAIYTGFSRISDYKHHWSDVLIGLLQGTSVAALTAVFVSDLFAKVPTRIVTDDQSTEPVVRSPKSYNSCSLEMERA